MILNVSLMIMRGKLEMGRSKRYYFLGVSTTKSSVNAAFPRWMDEFDLKADLVNVDLDLDSDENHYIEFCENLKDIKTVGSLVTSHKANLYRHCSDRFDQLSDDSRLLQEISSIRFDAENMTLSAHNTDIEACMRTLLKLTTENQQWVNGDRSIVVLGAGGSGLSILIAASRSIKNHQKCVISDVSAARIKVAKEVLHTNRMVVDVEDGSINDQIVEDAGRAPLVINATGMGKDLPGSPVNDVRCFPANSTFWELNYRGERPLYHALERRANLNGLRIEDGWEFFLDGWINNIRYAFNLTPEYLSLERFRLATRKQFC